MLEDVTDFLHAQRQVAWKEVAQRVAHEIKNPLTPIALSAERIRKHVDRPMPDSDSVIRKCSEVILGSVQTMRRLVDQFASLAQFPTSRPKVCDLNSIVESALCPVRRTAASIALCSAWRRHSPRAGGSGGVEAGPGQSHRQCSRSDAKQPSA